MGVCDSMTDKVVTTRTPLRISLAGGGTDTPVYFERYGGLVVSLTINQCVAVTIHESDMVIARDSWTYNHLKIAGMENADIAVSCTNPIKAKKSGMAMSSAYSVGLLKALFEYQGVSKSPPEIAELACKLNMETQGRDGVGFQDEYACAHGGLNAISFDDSGIELERFNPELGNQLANMLMLFKPSMDALDSGVMMRAVNHSYDPSLIRAIRHQIKGIAEELRNKLQSNNATPHFIGEILEDGWLLKKKLSPEMSNPEIDKAYKLAREAGALGGKICGAGGGGYLLVCCEENKKKSIREVLSKLPELQFNYERAEIE